MIMSQELLDQVGYSVVFWHVDFDILNKHYNGVLHCLNELAAYPGVSRVDVLPIEGDYTHSPEGHAELTALLLKYVDVLDVSGRG